MKFTHNLSLVLLSSTLTLPAFAHEISMGAGALNSTVFAQLTRTDNDTLVDTEYSATATAVTGEFYVGYAYNVNKGFDIGFEIFYDLEGPEVLQNTGDDYYLTYSVKNAIGIRMVPGFNITPSTRVIAEVGYLYMKTELDVENIVDYAFTNNTESKDVGVIVYGVGMETMLYSQFGLRASYVVAPTMGSDLSITSADTELTYTASPAMGYFYLGGIFRFGF
jgi:hypothetical protein